MKRLTILAVVLLTATAAFAQMPGHHEEMLSRIENFLQLTPDQKAQFEAAHTAFQASVQPLLDQRKSAHQALDALFARNSTDACAIGNAALAVHNVDSQLHTAHEAFKTKLETYLTPDQKTKLEAFAAMEHGPEGGHHD